MLKQSIRVSPWELVCVWSNLHTHTHPRKHMANSCTWVPMYRTPHLA